MTESIQNKGGKYESSLENVTEALLWVKKQIQRELSNLQKGVKEEQLKNSFYERKSDKVEYHMDLVKEYLQSCVDKEDFQINSAVVMAVQIALETQGYDVGKIDGLLKNNSGTRSNTEKAIMKFQKDNNLRVDGVPGTKTIGKILEKLGDIHERKEPRETKDNNNQESNGGESKEGENITSKELLALEIYRGKLMTNEEIEHMGYNPEEIMELVNNKQMIEKIDRIVPKKHKSNKKVTAPVEEEESDETKDSWESTNILVGPRLEATNRKECGGIGSSIMYGIQGLGTRANGFTNMAGKESGCADDSRFNEENGKLYENFIIPRKELIEYCTTHGIKSFMFYFGGNEKTQTQREQALKNIEKWGDYLEEGGIQPVLCTCIGEEIKEHKDESGNYYVKEYNKAIREMQQRKGWPLIDFAKIDEPDTFRPNDGWHPGTDGYNRMGTKIEQYFSSAEK